MTLHSRRDHDGHHRTRSRSPPNHRTRSRRSRSREGYQISSKRAGNITKPKSLPFKARELSKRDLESYRNLFALYLDVQKQLDLSALDEHEIKGRWKSYLRKWNEGDLAEGWYDPATKRKADEQAEAYELESYPRRAPHEELDMNKDDDDDDDDAEVGPALPGHTSSASQFGPAIPNAQDLRYRDEIIAANHSEARKELQYERKLERQQQKERLDELVPRADPGTRERQLEKKRDAAASRASFREARSPGAEDVRETDLMGDDGIDTYKRKKLEEEKRKTERQIRKEEIWRAKAEERQEKLAVMREKEDRTMDMLKSLAKQRFG